MVQGRPVTVPVCVRDALSITAMFTVRSDAVRALIAQPALQVPEILPGRALCVLAGVEYRDNDLGRYNEVAVSFFVTRAAARPLPLVGLLAGFARGTIASYIHRLPVTTSFSRDAGHDIWGFPKTVEQIEFSDAAGWRRCRLEADGRHVLTLEVKRHGGRTMPEQAQEVLAAAGGRLVRTHSTMAGDGVGLRPGGARVTLGAHPWADELRGAGLATRALFSTSIEHMRARFDAAEPL
jgi:hypothetical protein